MPSSQAWVHQVPSYDLGSIAMTAEQGYEVSEQYSE